jgi:hypothetical protein
MIDRQKMLEEQLLRENIRKAIRIVKEKHNKQEEPVRAIVRHLIKEASQVKYEYTALNLLAHFIKETVGDPSKPDSNPAFKDAYTDLSSGPEDREVFTEFLLDFANEDFNTMDANKQPKPLGQDFVEKGFVEDEPEEIEDPEEDEIINVSVGDLEENGGDLNPAEEDKEEITLGEDGEGVEIDEEPEPDSGVKIYSREAYKRVGPSLRRYYGQIEKDSMLKKGVEIDGKEYQPGELSERDLFQIYFKKNLVLWAGRYEDEFFGETPETQIDIEAGGEEEEIDLGGDEDMGFEAEEETELEL